MKRYIFFILLTVHNSYTLWTKLYKKKLSHEFSHEAIREHELGKYLLWSESKTILFNQLVFSWNSKRPGSGYFTFEVQARDTETKKWYKWHEAAHWGNGIQRTLYDNAKQDSVKTSTSYVYVRLELPKNHLADAFRIRVKTKNGAELGLIKQLAVSLSNFSLFSPELAENYYTRDYRSITIHAVPVYCQMILDDLRADSMCSPTSLAMLVAYFLQKDIDPLNFAYKVYDPGLDAYGNWLLNIAHAYEVTGSRAYFSVARLASFAQLYQLLAKKIPVVVSVRGALLGAPKPSYDSGHLLIVVGYDSRTRSVLCHDPAAPDKSSVVRSYNLENFLGAWERSHRLAYCAEPVVMRVNKNNKKQKSEIEEKTDGEKIL
jgi:hypothetical protein